ncbi:MAG: right-handed parallel beta-helix repeat-containing protein [Clostridia bacterium]|nr:right-handed parallel beta-helix repeat-containing protein [Clostridia bacterium]
MKKIFLCGIIISLLLLALCSCAERGGEVINAAEHGLSAENTGELNSKALQAIIDEAAQSGKTVYIPAGEYEFAANGKQTIGSHCIKMRSGVSIVGDGSKTVLKPVGRTRYGLDMFYFNDYLDKGEAIFLENCRFENFVIDGSGTSCEVYNSAGKGFMFNLFKNCHFKNVTVKNTDATGFGVDCPVRSTISGCTAIGCGKAATHESSGASGFGIGFGYCEEESIVISDCTALGNKKFGFFFEHQGRFSSLHRYNALPSENFTVKNCYAAENLFGFGGINTFSTVYENCVSEKSLRYGFFFEDSFGSGAVGCKSKNEKEACFAALQDLRDQDIPLKTEKIYFSACEGEGTPIGILTLGGADASAPTADKCVFRNVASEYEKREK